MRYNKVLVCSLFLVLILCNCNGTQNSQRVICVKNASDLNRTSETVSISFSALKNLTAKYEPDDLLVKNQSTGDILVRQLVDNDADGKPDELLFQVDIAPGQEKKYLIFGEKNGAARQPQSELTTYSRFAPERIDDYAWENDRVAFRTYGPEAQRLVEENNPNGTLSSGIDLWLKRVSYPIINKWYKMNTNTIGYYHIDHGEGYDPYHVGTSRGNGGSGVWKDDSLMVSKNFVSYKTIAEGPVRTIFELTYAPWSPYKISETKRISLDLGSNFSKISVCWQSEQPVPNYTLGITLHDYKGEVKTAIANGWFRYWEPIDDSFVGEGVVLDPAAIDTAFVHTSPTPDQTQFLVVTKPKNNSLTYYTGFAWEKSGQVKNVTDWDEILRKQATILKNPLKITIE